MAKVPVRVRFGRVRQNIQTVKSDDGDVMVSKMYCVIIHDGKQYDSFVDVKQVTGSDIEMPDSIEVSRPYGYPGPIDFSRFVTIANEHYKKSIGKQGKMITVVDASNATLANNVVDGVLTDETLEVDTSGPGGW